MHIYEVKARFWADGNVVETIFLFTGDNYSEAAGRVEEYFADDLCGFSIAELETPLLIDTEILADWKTKCDACKENSLEG